MASNCETHMKEILDLIIDNIAVDKQKNQIVHCDDIICNNCIFGDSRESCKTARTRWLE
jgi:hypothetical protein